MIECDKCGRKISFLENTYGTNGKNTVCASCYVKFREETLTGERIKHGGMDAETTMIKCPYCYKPFPNVPYEKDDDVAGLDLLKLEIIPDKDFAASLKNKPHKICPHCNMKVTQDLCKNNGSR